MFGNLYKERETKFFIVKSANRENLELAFEHKVWATTTLNETRWNEAFMVIMINISIVYHTSVFASSYCLIKSKLFGDLKCNRSCFILIV